MVDYLDKLIERAYKAMGKPLTTKQRKSMKSGTFCGPGRSFPVPNCKYVGVARSFLGRSKFSSSTKKKIAACINKKEKSLGCKGAKKAKAYIELSAVQKKLYSSEEFITTKQLVDASVKDPGKNIEHYLNFLLDK
jgi:hypothetical protein